MKIEEGDRKKIEFKKRKLKHKAKAPQNKIKRWLYK
jgi:hypothetical protein